MHALIVCSTCMNWLKGQKYFNELFLYLLLPERARSAGQKSRQTGHPRGLSVLGNLVSNLYCVDLSWIWLYRKIIHHCNLTKALFRQNCCSNHCQSKWKRKVRLCLFLKLSVSNAHALSKCGTCRKVTFSVRKNSRSMQNCRNTVLVILAYVLAHEIET